MMAATLITSMEYICSDCSESLDQKECLECGHRFNFEDLGYEIGCLHDGDVHICSDCLEKRNKGGA